MSSDIASCSAGYLRNASLQYTVIRAASADLEVSSISMTKLGRLSFREVQSHQAIERPSYPRKRPCLPDLIRHGESVLYLLEQIFKAEWHNLLIEPGKNVGWIRPAQRVHRASYVTVCIEL